MQLAGKRLLPPSTGDRAPMRALHAGPLAGSPAERYLAARGIRIRDVPFISHVLLSHPRARCADKTHGLAMVALTAIATEGGLIKRGVQLTFLAHDGAAKAHIASPRVTYGPAKGAGVFLGPSSQARSSSWAKASRRRCQP